jgi:hypothetical protein
VEVDAIRAHLGQQMHDLHGRHRPTNRLAERIAADIAHGPKAKGELVLGVWEEVVGHGDSVMSNE